MDRVARLVVGGNSDSRVDAGDTCAPRNVSDPDHFAKGSIPVSLNGEGDRWILRLSGLENADQFVDRDRLIVQSQMRRACANTYN